MLADIGYGGGCSHDILPGWLRTVLPPPRRRAAAQSLESLLFWTEVLVVPGPGLVRAKRPLGATQPRDADLTVVLATANVLTLRPREERAGAESSARRILLEDQLANYSLHFVGVQESRARRAEHRAAESLL